MDDEHWAYHFAINSLYLVAVHRARAYSHMQWLDMWMVAFLWNIVRLCSFVCLSICCCHLFYFCSLEIIFRLCKDWFVDQFLLVLNIKSKAPVVLQIWIGRNDMRIKLCAVHSARFDSTLMCVFVAGIIARFIINGKWQIQYKQNQQIIRWSPIKSQ